MTVTVQDKPTTYATNSAAVRESIVGFSKGNLDRAIAPYAQDAEVLDPIGKHVGKAQILASFEIWHNAFPDAKGDVTNQIAEGDQVLTEVTFTGTHTGPLTGAGMTLPPTGKKIEMRVAFVNWFKNGKIQKERGYYDIAGLMQQLGVTPTGR
jgi:steroid delta-isomerase-like uncharacterized protein